MQIVIPVLVLIDFTYQNKQPDYKIKWKKFFTSEFLKLISGESLCLDNYQHHQIISFMRTRTFG